MKIYGKQRIISAADLPYGEFQDAGAYRKEA